MGQQVSDRVIFEVARIRDEPLTNLPPLYDVLDPDALDRLWSDDIEGWIEFEYADCRVRISESGVDAGRVRNKPVAK